MWLLSHNINGSMEMMLHEFFQAHAAFVKKMSLIQSSRYLGLETSLNMVEDCNQLLFLTLLGVVISKHLCCVIYYIYIYFLKKKFNQDYSFLR